MLRSSVIVLMFLLAGCGGSTPAAPTQQPVSAQSAVASAPTDVPVADTEATLAAAVAPTLTAAAGQGMVARNRAWVNVERDVDGVVMVEVPPGCFTMGSEDGRNDERPMHTLCFYTHFWIDKFEVTQAQFVAHAGVAAIPRTFSGDALPVEQITWFEARDYCFARGGRLPTEAEWEYAARGPDGWTYPWGANFVETNAIFRGNSGRGTANVGSKPLGGAWVGAHDMSGNVWEWTSSRDMAYPYDAADGREADDATTANARRVLRGGAWNSDDPSNLRTSARLSRFAVAADSGTGFRCVRDA